MIPVRSAGTAAVLWVATAAWGLCGPPAADAPIEYRLSFPAPEHHRVQVDAVFRSLPEPPLQLVMSSASPGRYARHDFAKNLVELTAADEKGEPLPVERTGPSTWTVATHRGTVRVRYRLFGDRVDGTYLAIDTTHAHLNMPATLLWVPGLEDRSVRVRIDPPPETAWRIATQLFPTDDPQVFTAPNFQYLMDSPIEASAFDLREFSVPDPLAPDTRPRFRLAVHHDADPGAIAPYAAGVEAIVRETLTVFGEFPPFETGTYTFIADYLPYASPDAMEHRNSTVLTSRLRLEVPAERVRMLRSVAHEFFHAWNVERIRPASLEPFDFTAPNMSSDLWLAEGFTTYYAALILHRAGVADLSRTLARFAEILNPVMSSPARRLNGVLEMSRLAPFTDAATAIDPTNFGNTFISYYTWGAAIGLGLDLALRVRSEGAVTLDDFMRELWVRFGRPGGALPGSVAAPYKLPDVEAVLATVSGDRSFAREFFRCCIEGREVAPYAALLEHAALVLQPAAPGRAWLGPVSIGPDLRVMAPTAAGSPLYEAGVDRGDVLIRLGDRQLNSRRDLAWILARHAPGDALAIEFHRRGAPVTSTLRLAADPRLELVTREAAGRGISEAQRAFRAAWLGSRQRQDQQHGH